MGNVADAAPGAKAIVVLNNALCSWDQKVPAGSPAARLLPDSLGRVHY